MTGHGDERDDLAERLEGVDAPRPLPAGLRDRLEASLLAPHQPGRFPADVRARLERSMAGPRIPAARARFLAVAAALLLVVATAAVFVRSGPGGGDDGITVAGPSEPTPGVARDQGGDAATGGGSGVADVPQAGAPSAGDAGDGSGATDEFGAAPGAAAPAAGGTGSVAENAPPFAFGDDSAFAAPSPDATTGAGRAEAGGDTGGTSTVRIGVVSGDHHLEAGFLAYLDLLEAAGGVGGRRVVAVPASADEPASGTVATVNLSGEPLAGAGGVPAWVQQPLLEGPHAPEAVLRGSVLSFTSVLERQAHLAALSAFPEPAPGATAAVYHARSGPYADRVPAALTEALRTRGVTAVLLPTDATAPGLVPADVAFVSLPNGDAGPMLRAMADAGYDPPLGVWGVGSLFDEELVDAAPAGLRVLSPYTVPGPREAAALRAGAGRALTTGTVHGWVTAKSIAVALWRSEAATATALDTALAGLAGYANGFMPPYEVRPGTRSRTPEGLVLVPGDGGWVAAGPFERDPL